MPRLACVTLACLASGVLAGCEGGRAPRPPNHSAAEVQLAKAAATRLAGIFPKPVEAPNESNAPAGSIIQVPCFVITDDLLGDLWHFVEIRFRRGDVSELAALINVEGPWQERQWFPFLLTYFARGFTEARPIRLEGADAAIRALTKIAEGPSGRAARVYAATALRFEHPDLARRVLKEEYGRFWVRRYQVEYVLPGFDTPPCGPTLSRLGVWARDEITSTWRAAEMLRLAGRPADAANEPALLAEAADRYNALLRKAVVEEDRALQWELGDWPDRLERFAAIYDDVRKNWEPPKEDPRLGNLFGP
ncbi:MAG: hypothetical protein AMK72_10840 [Planctomycetes bacterium SM23_25]|nr:MAG: hypothetical protein AMK72_10840 [Planctomycetes bacterium SM23_25]